MIYYRQKMLLALVDALGGNVPATDFQKHLFIYTTLFEKKKSYDFVPYKNESKLGYETSAKPIFDHWRIQPAYGIARRIVLIY